MVRSLNRKADQCNSPVSCCIPLCGRKVWSMFCISSSNKDMRTPAPVLTQPIFPVVCARLLSAQSLAPSKFMCSCYPREMTLSLHSRLRKHGETGMHSKHIQTFPMYTLFNGKCLFYLSFLTVGSVNQNKVFKKKRSCQSSPCLRTIRTPYCSLM